MVTIYVAYVKPYKSQALNYIDLCNESFFLIYNYLLFAFTDNYNVQSNDQMGWLLISVIEFPYAINLLYQFFVIYKFLRFKIYEQYCKHKKKVETIKTNPTSINNFFTLGD